MRGGLRLSLGCGPHYADGWTNIDRFDTYERKPDVVLDMRTEKLEKWIDDNEQVGVERIFIGHALEHMPLADAASVVRRCFEILEPHGGELLLVGPDLVEMAAAVEKGERTWEDFWDAHGTAGQGKGWSDGYCHEWSCTVEALLLMVRSAGFTAFTRRDPYRLWEEQDWPVVSGAPGQAAVYATTALDADLFEALDAKIGETRKR